MKHKHHIVPKHMGGSDDPSNLIEVSIEEHAELHLALYLENSRWQDWFAYHGLSGQMNMSDIHKEAMKRGSINSHIGRTKEERQIAARKANSTEVKTRKSETMIKRRKEKPNWVDYTEEVRDKLSNSTRLSQAKMRARGQHIGRKAKVVLYKGKLYNSIKDMSESLGIHLHTCYKKIYSGEAQYQ